MPDNKPQAIAILTRDGTVEHVYVVSGTEYPTPEKQQATRNAAKSRGLTWSSARLATDLR